MERERLDVDVLIVGGGPAGLSAALRLTMLQKLNKGKPLSVAVLEKAPEAGAHMLSGAILDSSGLDEVVSDWKERGAPLEAEVSNERVYLLTRNRKFRFPITPSPLRNHGNYIISLNRLIKWLNDQVIAEGVDVFTGFAANQVLFDGDRVVGVRTGDRGVDRHGAKKSNFQLGVDINAKVTIFADGARGNLTKILIRKFSLDKGCLPQSYGIGFKELWDVSGGSFNPGSVLHTIGYPLKHEEYGGGFIYSMPGDKLSVGFVAGLDYRDPLFDPYVAFQQFKQHPLISELLKHGQMIRSGAKAIPIGGWHAIPRGHMEGALIVGDAIGLVNSLRLKGIHLAMSSGARAAETAFEAIRINDSSVGHLKKYTKMIKGGTIYKELYPARNVHQSFTGGLFTGILYSALALITRGWWIRDPMPGNVGYSRIQSVESYYGRSVSFLGEKSMNFDSSKAFDRLTSVHYSGTHHVADQPSHLIIQDTDLCRTRCLKEYRNPCIRFCPANVYEIIDSIDGIGDKQLKINPSNCIHCKTCDIMDPYQIINWVPPEGGGGPRYEGM